MKYLFLTFLLIPIITLSQTENLTDEFGRKQGVHIENGFERTYRNDTLNGRFKWLTENGKAKSLGYYKNGKQDSLWIEFNWNGIIEERECYKEGLKNGEFTTYHENGKISYNAYFLNDTLVGEEKYFYPSGKLETKEKGQYGESYYESGTIKSIRNYNSVTGIYERYAYTEDGKQKFPYFNEQSIIKNDKSIINTSNLKIYSLFGKRYEIKDAILIKGETLFHPFPICDNGDLKILLGATQIEIKPNGIQVGFYKDTVCVKETKCHGFTTNLRIDSQHKKELKNYFFSDIGKIEIDNRRMRCGDTENNPIKITSNGKSVLFNDIGNLVLYEFDSDKNGRKELYIISYFSCSGILKIYKVV